MTKENIEEIIKTTEELTVEETAEVSEEEVERKKNTPDISLPKDQYIEEMIKKRKDKCFL